MLALIHAFQIFLCNIYISRENVMQTTPTETAALRHKAAYISPH